jgi:hypothetical protein
VFRRAMSAASQLGALSVYNRHFTLKVFQAAPPALRDLQEHFSPPDHQRPSLGIMKGVDLLYERYSSPKRASSSRSSTTLM